MGKLAVISLITLCSGVKELARILTYTLGSRSKQGNNKAASIN